MTAPANDPSGRPPGARRNRFDTVTGRTVLVAVVVATVAVLVAAAVSVPLIRQAAENEARATLGRLADLTAEALESPRPGGVQRVRSLLAGQSTDAYLVSASLPLPPGVPAEVVQALALGQPVSTTVQSEGASYFIEGRPVGNGGGVVLIAPATVAETTIATSVSRLAVALLIGLVVAVAVAVLAARRMTRPLRQAAQAAERLRAGERDITIDPDGPAEVADLADSLNRLSAALSVSEGRQREFLLSVSHELRTPLTTVQGYAEAMADGLIGPDDVRRTGDVLSAESRRLERLVADLLDLSRLGAADLRIEARPIDLAGLMADAARAWGDRCRREGVDLQVEVAGPAVVSCDPVRVRQIVDNLAENALRVTPAGRPIVFAADAADGWARLQVRDGGPGLEPEDLEVAFEPAVLYTRYQGVRPVGSGIGLALVGRLANRLGGVAEAGHAPEGGAQFTVRIPLLEPPAA